MARNALLPALILLAFAAACGAGEAEVTVREYPAGWRSGSMMPVVVDARSPAGGRLEIDVKEQRYEQSVSLSRRLVELPAGEPVRVEIPVPAHDWQIVTWRLGGQSGENSLGQRALDDDDFRMYILCVNGVMLADCLDEAGRRGVSGSPPGHLPLDLLPARWQSYVGLGCTLVMADRDAARLSPEQRGALGRWVRWLGGSLWLTGVDAAVAAGDLGLDLLPAARERLGGVDAYSLSSGRVVIQAEPDAGPLFDLGPMQPGDHLLRRHFQAWHRHSSYAPPFWAETDRLVGIGSGTICLALAVLAVVMGPLNFWYVRRRRNALLFFVATPLLALTGVAAIFGLSVAREGLGGRYVECAALVRPAASDEGLLLDVRGVRPGFTVPQLAFGDDALVYPVSGIPGFSGRGYVVDYTNGVRLVGDWFRPRSASGLVLARPVTVRMRLEIEEGVDGVFATNNLGFGVKRMAARLADGRTGWAENVRPGDRVVLARENNGRRLDALREDLGMVSGGADSRDIWLAAECEGLPYIDGGGLSASRAAGWYWYFETDRGRAR